MKKIVLVYNLGHISGLEILGFILFTYGLLTESLLMWISGLIFLGLNHLEIGLK